jgi:hypothetical protein
MVAAAMYLSVDAYSSFREKELRLEAAKLTGKYLEAAQKEYEAARKDFIFTLTKNILLPSFMITAYAICWPAAMAFTVLYLGYELYHSYDQYTCKKNAAELASKPPLIDSDSDLFTGDSDDEEMINLGDSDSSLTISK